MPSPALPDIRNASAADADDLASIRAQCFDSHWHASEFAAMLEQPHTYCLIIPRTAYVLLQCIPPEAEVITLAVVPELRRQGIAECLMRQMITDLKSSNVDTLHLEVSEKQRAAISLYKKIGFVPTGRRANYYRNAAGETTDAILMQLHLLG